MELEGFICMYSITRQKIGRGRESQRGEGRGDKNVDTYVSRSCFMLWNYRKVTREKRNRRGKQTQAYLDLTVGITAPTIIRISTITYKGISISETSKKEKH